jgi:undecaprenyl-diphosphatase
VEYLLDLILFAKAAVMGIVEGLTEFLPVSSTGHLILAGSLLNFNDARGKLFEIVIQSAAILAVVWEFRARIKATLVGLGREPKATRLLVNVAVAFLPLAVLGLVFGKMLQAELFNAPTVATTFILGGLIILWAERRTHTERITSIDEMTWLDALKVGIAQAFALIPGTSRSGATIIGGMLFGLSRQVATEFTFYLAIPTLGIASIYSLYKERALLSHDDLGMWGVGMAASFISAFVCVRWLLRYISSHTFVPFAWYRIGFGLLVLATWLSGTIVWSD